MEEQSMSPRIMNQSWGRIEVDGYEPFKDVKLYPGGAKAWNWDETGTRHSPGVQPADVEELLAHGATTVILTMGVLGRLKIQPETRRQLQERGITVHIVRTAEGVKLYNKLREIEPVGALVHSTC